MIHNMKQARASMWNMKKNATRRESSKRQQKLLLAGKLSQPQERKLVKAQGPSAEVDIVVESPVKSRKSARKNKKTVLDGPEAGMPPMLAPCPSQAEQQQLAEAQRAVKKLRAELGASERELAAARRALLATNPASHRAWVQVHVDVPEEEEGAPRVVPAPAPTARPLVLVQDTRLADSVAAARAVLERARSLCQAPHSSGLLAENAAQVKAAVEAARPRMESPEPLKADAPPPPAGASQELEVGGLEDILTAKKLGVVQRLLHRISDRHTAETVGQVYASLNTIAVELRSLPSVGSAVSKFAGAKEACVAAVQKCEDVLDAALANMEVTKAGEASLALIRATGALLDVCCEAHREAARVSHGTFCPDATAKVNAEVARLNELRKTHKVVLANTQARQQQQQRRLEGERQAAQARLVGAKKTAASLEVEAEGLRTKQAQLWELVFKALGSLEDLSRQEHSVAQARACVQAQAERLEAEAGVVDARLAEVESEGKAAAQQAVFTNELLDRSLLAARAVKEAVAGQHDSHQSSGSAEKDAVEEEMLSSYRQALETAECFQATLEWNLKSAQGELGAIERRGSSGCLLSHSATSIRRARSSLVKDIKQLETRQSAAAELAASIRARMDAATPTTESERSAFIAKRAAVEEEVMQARKQRLQELAVSDHSELIERLAPLKEQVGTQSLRQVFDTTISILKNLGNFSMPTQAAALADEADTKGADGDDIGDVSSPSPQVKKRKNSRKKKQATGPNTCFLCPITLQVMKDPVVAADGHTYERTALESWLKKHKTSPVTRLPMAGEPIIPNYALKHMIAEAKQ